MKPFELTLSVGGQTLGKVSGAFTDEEWALAVEYAEYASVIETTQWVRRGMATNLSVKWDEAQGLTTKTELPTDVELREFLHVLRPLILQDERTFFLKILKIFSRHIRLDGFAFFKQLKGQFTGHDFTRQVRIEVQRAGETDRILLNSDDFLRLWLNAYEYHRDRGNRARIEELHEVVDLEHTKALMLHLLVDKTRAILSLRGLIATFQGGSGTTFRSGS